MGNIREAWGHRNNKHTGHVGNKSHRGQERMGGGQPVDRRAVGTIGAISLTGAIGNKNKMKLDNMWTAEPAEPQ